VVSAPARRPFRRTLWMRLHAWGSVFFLPLACVYALSGALALTQEPATRWNRTLELSDLRPMAPISPDAVATLIRAELARADLPLPPGHLQQQGRIYRWGSKQQVEVKYTPSEHDPRAARLRVSGPTLYGRLIGFHKGRGGLHTALAIGFAVLLLMSYASGLWLALKTPWLKVSSLVILAAGALLTLLALR
jgi:hypothetical protein